MTTELKDKVALVTGAAKGIGKASALAFAREGANLILADLEEEEGRKTELLAQKEGVETLFIKADISKADQVDSLVSKAVDKFGKIDCAHNNAGVEGTRLLTSELDEDSFDKVIMTNLKGTWLCMRKELEQMLKQGGGSIVNTASIAAFVGLGGLSAYTASKHGIVGLTKASALEYAKQKIRINAVCPGPIETEMVENTLKENPQLKEALLALGPQGRIGKPEEVAAAVIWLSSPKASFVTGSALVVDGGWTAQ